MGSVSVECRVLVGGPRGAGKTALIQAFLGDQDPHCRGERSTTKQVGGRSVKFLIRESRSLETAADTDVILLCFSLACPPSLPSLPPVSPPVVLVGCQSDLRRDHQSRRGRSLVSPRSALALARHLAAVMYVETEAGSGHTNTSASAAFEVAALACLGQIPARPQGSSTSSGHAPIVHPALTTAASLPQGRAGSVPRLCLERTGSTGEFWERLRSPEVGRRVGGGLRERLGRATSLDNVNMGRAGMGGRQGGQERLVTIRCQRMGEDRSKEEVEIAVPESVYRNMETQQRGGSRNQDTKAGAGGLHLAARLKTWLIRV